jgi:hypothetical protein
MLASINNADIGAISAFIVAALAIGAVIGRGTRNVLNQRALRRHDDAQIKQAVVGKPKDDFGPAQPGLVEQMATLTLLANKTAEKLDDHLNGIDGKKHV